MYIICTVLLFTLLGFPDISNKHKWVNLVCVQRRTITIKISNLGSHIVVAIFCTNQKCIKARRHISASRPFLAHFFRASFDPLKCSADWKISDRLWRPSPSFLSLNGSAPQVDW